MPILRRLQLAQAMAREIDIVEKENFNEVADWLTREEVKKVHSKLSRAGWHRLDPPAAWGEIAADTETREKLGLAVKETWSTSEKTLEEATAEMEADEDLLFFTKSEETYEFFTTSEEYATDAVTTEHKNDARYKTYMKADAVETWEPLADLKVYAVEKDGTAYRSVAAATAEGFEVTAFDPDSLRTGCIATAFGTRYAIRKIDLGPIH